MSLRSNIENKLQNALKEKDKILISTLRLILAAIKDKDISNKISKVLDLTPYGIKKKLSLNKPIYARTASYGHFGRKPENDGGFSWEKIDLIESLQKILG